MGRFKALTYASVVALGAAQAAHAADLLPPPPPIEAPPLRGAVVEEPSGFYLRGDIGLGISEMGTTRSSFDDPTVAVPDARIDHAEIGDSTFVGVGLGYQFNTWFRADVTGEYRGQAAINTVASYNPTYNGVYAPGVCGNTASPQRCYDLYSGTVSSAVFLLNGYVDLGTWYGLTPYVGAGVGVSTIRVGSFNDRSVGNTGGGYSDAQNFTNFTWAAMAGLGYHVTQNLILEASYRYLDQGNVFSGQIVCQPNGSNPCPLERQHFHLASNDFRLGARWLLSGPAPMYDPGLPVRAKY